MKVWPVTLENGQVQFDKEHWTVKYFFWVLQTVIWVRKRLNMRGVPIDVEEKVDK